MSRSLIIITNLFFVLSAFLKYGNGARILASVSTASYSHQVAFRPIWKRLAERGHEIVLLTTDPMPDKIDKIKQIDLSFSYQKLEKFNYSAFVSKTDPWDVMETIDKLVTVFTESSTEQLLHPEVQKMLHNKSEQFDILMIECVIPIHFVFVEKFNAPVVGLTSLEASAELHEIMGNSAHPVLNPDFSMPFTYPLTFFQRVATVLNQIVMKYYGLYIFEPYVDRKIKSVFGENTKSLRDLFKRIELLFVNTNPIFHSIRAVTPSTIIFGGAQHLQDSKKTLPKDLKKILDESTEGVIYFSLGSNVKSTYLNDELKNVFIETFRELPYKILWKFETDNFPNKPNNVVLNKWFPQTAILGHPNIKLFITQCGLQSIEESIMNHVPMVGIPFFADQPANALILKKKGMGVQLEHSVLTKEIFKNSILEVINNPEYKKNVIEISELLTDVEMSGIDKVVWWTEYVIRNKGAKLLKNPIVDLPVYQYYLLDVIAFLAVILFILLFGTFKLLLLIFRKKK